MRLLILALLGAWVSAPAYAANASSLRAAPLNDATMTQDEIDFKRLEPRLRSAVISHNHRALIKLIDLPLRVNRGGWPVRTRYYRSRAAIERDFSKIFTAETLAALRGDFVSSGTGKMMAGIGNVWFLRACHARVCDFETGPFWLKVVNLDD